MVVNRLDLSFSPYTTLILLLGDHYYCNKVIFIKFYNRIVVLNNILVAIARLQKNNLRANLCVFTVHIKFMDAMTHIFCTPRSKT